MSARQPAGGAANHRALSSGKYAPRDLPLLPARSIRSDRNPFLNDDPAKERAAKSFAVVFFSLVFAIPMLLIGVILHFQ